MPQRTLLNQTRLPLKSKFIRQLRAYYEGGGDLWNCFLLYIGFLKMLGCEYLSEMIDFQYNDYHEAITGYKTMWHRSRRAGKTLGLTNLAIFFTIIRFGYRANKGKVIWRAPFNDQLEQAQDWLTQNPFVTWISNENLVYVLDSFPIDMGSLGSGGKVASKGAAVLIEDEYRDVYKGLKMYDLAGRAADMLAEGPSSHKRFISASTGCRLTLFHDHYLSGEWTYLRHSYTECPWITREYVESKAKEYPQDPYFVQQEFEAIWVPRGDTAYRNIYVVDMVAKTVTHNTENYEFGDHPFFPLNWQFPTARKAGCDFNDFAGHYVVTGSMDDEAIYVNNEYVITTISELKPFGENYSLEVEAGPFEINMENAKKCAAANINCIYRHWMKDIVALRFRISMDKMIIIDRHGAPYTLSNFEEAVFDENSRDTKLKKSPDQHGLDATLHMIHRTDYTSMEYKIQTNLDPNYVGGEGNRGYL